MREPKEDERGERRLRRTVPSRPRAATPATATHPECTGPGEAIDRKHLARYTLGDRDLEREILQLYCEQSERLVTQLRGAATQSDWGFAAHSIKGSARAVGAWQVADIAARLERLTPDAPECETELSALTAAMAQAVAEARAL